MSQLLKTNSKKLKSGLSTSLSGEDILKLVDNKAKIITYPDLKKFKNIDELFMLNNCIVILYLTSAQYGHWTCLINHNDRIEFFDSYSEKPDKEFDYIDKSTRKNHNYRGKPYLSTLLLKSKKPVEYNHQQLQQDGDNIATCGRWVSLRIILKNYSIEEFIKMFMSIPETTPDEASVILTYNKLKK